MIHYRLNAVRGVEAPDAHPDEDAICAFMEGRLEDAGASQIVSHLIVCGSCRHATAEFTRLDFQDDAEMESPLEDVGPGRMHLLVKGLASRIIPSHEDDAVFAYHEPEGNSETSESVSGEPDKPPSESSSSVDETEPE